MAAPGLDCSSDHISRHVITSYAPLGEGAKRGADHRTRKRTPSPTCDGFRPGSKVDGEIGVADSPTPPSATGSARPGPICFFLSEEEARFLASDASWVEPTRSPSNGQHERRGPYGLANKGTPTLSRPPLVLPACEPSQASFESSLPSGPPPCRERATPMAPSALGLGHVVGVLTLP